MTAGILLCAGGSTRFIDASNKLLAPFRGRPLVSWALGHVGGAKFDEIIVVVGPIDLREVLAEEVVVKNRDWASGVATSLRAGVAEAERRGHDVVVVGLGDQPLVPSSAWVAVAEAECPIAVANLAGHRTPPVRLARAVWPLLPIAGDVGARELIRARPELVCEVACEGHYLDIDTAEDLAVWS